MKNNRRNFLKQTAKAAAATYATTLGFSAKSYANILGANDRVRLGVVGYSDRFRQAHLPSFLNHYKELNFDIVAVSDLWKVRREEGSAFLEKTMGHGVRAARNNDELYAGKDMFIVKSHLQKPWRTTEMHLK
jgi:hypothetical protein